MSLRRALLLPGQGYQKAGVLAEFKTKLPRVVDPILEEIDATLPNLELSKALTDPGYSSDITRTYIAQPLILSASYAIFKAYQHQFPEHCFKYALGHSLGEYSAWTVAGILPFNQAVRLVHERGLAMYDATKGTDTGMLLVVKPRKGADDFDAQVAEAAASAGVDIANLNSSTQTVLSGEKQQLETALSQIKSKYARLVAKPLDVSGAFHSRWMESAQPRLKKLASNIDWQFPSPRGIEVVSNLAARPFESVDEVKTSCYETLVKPVQWNKSTAWAAKNVDSITSIGPGRIGKLSAGEYDTPTEYYDAPE